MGWDNMNDKNKKSLKDAIYNALESGWYFDDICNAVAKTLNAYKEEKKEKDNDAKENRRNQKSY